MEDFSYTHLFSRNNNIIITNSKQTYNKTFVHPWFILWFTILCRHCIYLVTKFSYKMIIHLQAMPNFQEESISDSICTYFASSSRKINRKLYSLKQLLNNIPNYHQLVTQCKSHTWSITANHSLASKSHANIHC